MVIQSRIHTRSNSIASDKRSGQEREPERADVRVMWQVSPNRIRQHPAVCTDLIRVLAGFTCVAPLKNVQVFVLNQARGWVHGSILKLVNLLEWHREVKLFPNPPYC